jgi:hypothetical protein
MLGLGGGRRAPAWVWVAAITAAMVLTPIAAYSAGTESVAAPNPREITNPLPEGTETATTAVDVRYAAARLLPRAAGKATAPAQPASLLVRVTHSMSVHAEPSVGSAVVGVLPAASKYYRVPISAWILRVSKDRAWGLIEIPYVSPVRLGWIRLEGMTRAWTKIEVTVDLSARRLTVTRSGHRLFVTPVAIGAPWSPTPPGRYFVTDRVPFWVGSALGSFAFGISGIQPRLPAGWSGGDQLAIHGTNDPASIGGAVSAGCVRVSETALSKLRPLLVLGTPVIIRP